MKLSNIAKKKVLKYTFFCLLIYLPCRILNAISFDSYGIEGGYVYFDKQIVNQENYDSSLEKLYVIGIIDSIKHAQMIIHLSDSSTLDTKIKKINDYIIKYERDSVFTMICESGKLDYFYYRILQNRNGLSGLFPDISTQSDTLSIIKSAAMTLHGLDLFDFIKRNELFREAFNPLGYKEFMHIDFTFFGPVWNTEFSYPKIFIAWLFGWYIYGSAHNPIMFICLPVGIGFLIFSRNTRRQTVTFLRRTFNKLKQWFRLR